MSTKDWRAQFTPKKLEERKQYQREYQRAYRQTPEGKKYSRLAWAKYNVKVGPDVLKEQKKRALFDYRLRQVGADHKTVLELLKQGCMICGKKNLMAEKKRVLCIDHDHATGQFRGILCNGCNTALGQFDDDPRMLMRAIRYLKGR